MDLTFVSHFTARPVTAGVFKQHLLDWHEGVKQLSGISVVEAAQRFITSEGDLSEPSIEGIGNGEGDDKSEKLLGFGFEGTLLLQDDCAVKTRMIVRFGESEFAGEIYVTTMNFPLKQPVEKRFFSLWSILYGNVIKESTPFMWTPVAAPRILMEETPLHIIVKIINFKQKNFYVDTMEARRNFLSGKSMNAEDEEPITAPTTTEITANTENSSPEAEPQKNAEQAPESTPDTENAAQAEPASETAPKIAEFQELLEKYKSENEELSEKNEQLTSINRELRKMQKTYLQNIEDQKNRLKVLKKRAESAETRAKEAASGDVKEFCDYFDKERERLEMESAEKEQIIEKLRIDLDMANGMVTTLKGRLNKQNMGNGIYGLLAAPEDEAEKYENEFGIALLSALHKAIDKTPTKNNSPHTRSIDVWQAIIDANPDLEKNFEQYCDDTIALKNAIVGGELDKKKYLLKPFNLDFNDHSNNHGRISFGNDDRYIASTASTASETACGFSNCAKDLRNTFLFPT